MKDTYTFTVRKLKYGLYKYIVDEYKNGELNASRSFKDLIALELDKQQLIGRGYTENA